MMFTFEMSGDRCGKHPKKDTQMSSRNNHHIMPWNNQNQDQGQHQGQAEAQLQGQLQGQGQGQGQHQSQSSENDNANGNLNGSLNLNGNANGNLNYNENGANNAAHNAAYNEAVNHNDTDVTTTVTTDVSVNANVDLSGYMPTDDDFADIDLSDDASIDTLLVGKGDISFDPGNEQNIDDILNESLTGAGNDTGTVNSQFNNLVDSDVLHNATVDGNLTQTNTSTGGTATSDDGIDAGSEDGEDMGWAYSVEGGGGHDGGWGDDDDAGTEAGNWGSGNGDDGFVSGESLSSAASAIDTTAFNQSIVMGANVLGNTVDMSVVGGNMNSTYVGDDSSDGA
jgi:hypothetical protein